MEVGAFQKSGHSEFLRQLFPGITTNGVDLHGVVCNVEFKESTRGAFTILEKDFHESDFIVMFNWDTGEWVFCWTRELREKWWSGKYKTNLTFNQALRFSFYSTEDEKQAVRKVLQIAWRV